MLKTPSALVAVAFMLAVPTHAQAEKQLTLTSSGNRPGLHATEVKKLNATVSEINYEYRRVTLTDSEGRNTVLTIDPQARNFEQVKQGDKVSIETVEAFAIQVTPNGEKTGHDSITYVHIAKPGEKPHGVAVQTKHITAIVEAIDYKARTVTMKGPEGHVRVFKVDPIAKRFNEVKKGDEITVKITEAIALSVTRAGPN
jgi:hypothetical protein